MLSELLQGLRLRSDGGHAEETWLEEQLYALLGYLLRVHADLLRQIDSLSAVRPSTRLEQYRRVRRARDFIAANFASQLSLAEIGRVACLSPYHLLRLFKEAFGETPHQYATRRRLDRARALLEGTELSVAVIGRQVGYASLGSFSRLFRRHFGVSPRKLRAGCRRT